MLSSLDEYHCRLVNKILSAGSQGEVNRFCEAAVKGLETHRLNNHLIQPFVDKVICELEGFNPMNKEAQQWSNIIMARIYFKRVKQRLITAVD
jgi:hypothetical protein